ncbi:MAG: helix-turn-helix transcriptional regulator [Nitrospiraceae bacterium]|nr:helix-turn-helix transcriptional regulator [Nitrospiraceae bacterium]
MHSNLGERIRLIRQKYHLKQHEFAVSLGISQGYLSEIEKGYKEPSDTILIVISNLYAINKEWLQKGSGAMMMEASEIGEIIMESKAEYVCDLIRRHNNTVLNNMIGALMRIMDEGDFRKMAAIQSLITFADPGKKKEEGSK